MTTLTSISQELTESILKLEAVRSDYDRDKSSTFLVMLKLDDAINALMEAKSLIQEVDHAQ